MEVLRDGEVIASGVGDHVEGLYILMEYTFKRDDPGYPSDRGPDE